MTVNLHQILTQLLQSKLPRPNAVRSNVVKQLDCCGRGNLKCKCILFLVQISVQIHRNKALRSVLIGFCPVYGVFGTGRSLTLRNRWFELPDSLALHCIEIDTLGLYTCTECSCNEQTPNHCRSRPVPPGQLRNGGNHAPHSDSYR